jgi:hypothetical protein
LIFPLAGGKLGLCGTFVWNRRFRPFRITSLGLFLPPPADSPARESAVQVIPMSLTALEMLDRLERTDGNVADDPRLKRVHEALDVLKKVKQDRAEQVQLTFSRPYDDGWQQTLKVKPR